jgi:hypothetical protein
MDRSHDLQHQLRWIAGHFLVADAGNARGFWANQLDPKFLAYNTSTTNNLGLSGAQATTFCQTNHLPCPANFTSSQNIATALRPFPFQGVTDYFGNVSNSNYHALQTQLNMRAAHGLTFIVNYTWSRSIDNGGTFRSGYDIPAAFSGNGRAWKQGRIERSVSRSNQPHHLVVTGVWDMPFGRTVFAGTRGHGQFLEASSFQRYSRHTPVLRWRLRPQSAVSIPRRTVSAQALVCRPTIPPSLVRHASTGDGVMAIQQRPSIPLTRRLLNHRVTNSSMSAPRRTAEQCLRQHVAHRTLQHLRPGQLSVGHRSDTQFPPPHHRILKTEPPRRDV